MRNLFLRLSFKLCFVELIREFTIGQRERGCQSKNARFVPVLILDLKDYDATTRTPRMKWRELSQNQNKHGRDKY